MIPIIIFICIYIFIIVYPGKKEKKEKLERQREIERLEKENAEAHKNLAYLKAKRDSLNVTINSCKALITYHVNKMSDYIRKSYDVEEIRKVHVDITKNKIAIKNKETELDDVIIDLREAEKIYEEASSKLKELKH